MLIDRRTLILGAATLAAAASAESATADAAAASSDGPAERVLGIGGLFFRAHDPKKLAQWYQDNLGIDPIPRDHNHHAWEQAAGPTAFAPFSMTSNYFEVQQGWMLNFRVRSLDAMVAQLRKAGIEVKVDPDKYPNGRFARTHDPEGNPIELWEPLNAA